MASTPTSSTPTRLTASVPAVSRQDELQQARNRLDAAITAHSGDRLGWSERLGEAVSELVLAIQVHRDTAEGPDGLLDQIVTTAPRLIGRAHSQRVEHAVLLSEASLLQAALLRQQAEAAISVQELRDRASILLDRVRDHVARAGDLIFDALVSDVGGES